MNLLGRLFIVLIFIGSVMFMAMSIALYATHTNWREHAERLDRDLRQRTQDLAELQRQKDAMEAAMNLEIRRQANNNLALATRVRQLTQDNDEARDGLADLRRQLDAQVAAVASVSNETALLRARLDGANEALHTSQNEWMAMSTELIRTIDEAHGLAIQVANYQTISWQLAQDYRDAVEVLRRLGVTADLALLAAQPPAGIRGSVTEVRPGGVVEISIGSDSGLARGHHLDIVRNRDGRSSYIGKIELTNVTADRAVGRVMPEFRRGVVQRNDEVTFIDVHEFVAH